MLVLERETNGIIKIGEDIEVLVVAVNGRKIKLGITAPHELAISRATREARHPVGGDLGGCHVRRR